MRKERLVLRTLGRFGRLMIATGLVRSGLYARLAPRMYRQRAALAQLEPTRTVTPDQLFDWTVETAGKGVLALLSFAGLSALSGQLEWCGIGLLIAFVVVLQANRQLKRKVEERKRAIRLDLPEVVSRIGLYIGAGESIRRSLERAADCRSLDFAGNAHPLYAELRAAVAAMQRGEPMAVVLEEFGRRCGVVEARQLGTILTLHASRGGETLLAVLSELSRTLWEKRKAVALTLGEQASARLAFPMVIVFLIILALAGAPALLFM